MIVGQELVAGDEPNNHKELLFEGKAQVAKIVQEF